ncbi:MAG: c-type cytochrome [Pseudomonadota bacterium]
MTRLLAAVLACVMATVALAGCPAPQVLAQQAGLTVAGRDTKRLDTRQALLALPGVRNLTIPDPVYRRTMTYRAVPLTAILKGVAIDADDYVQARATDDFSVAIPARLLLFDDPARAEAFLAIEDAAAPWPRIPGKPYSAGPFYIVWKLAPSVSVSSEYWAYRLAALAVTDSPTKRWPVLAVGPEIGPDDPIRMGLDRFVSVCMACHRFDGAGEGEQGPDLARPMNPVDYFQLPALKKLIRDPASVRQWADQKMPGFDAATLSDRDIDAIVAWLSYKARRQR